MTGTIHQLRQIAAETPLDINKDWRQFMTDCAKNEPVRIAGLLATCPPRNFASVTPHHDYVGEAPMAEDVPTPQEPVGLNLLAVLGWIVAVVAAWELGVFAVKAAANVARAFGWL